MGARIVDGTERARAEVAGYLVGDVVDGLVRRS